MTSRTWQKYLVIPLLVISLLTSAGSRPASAFFGPLTIEKEKQLGEEFFLTLQQFYPVVKDPFLNSYLNGVGQKLVRQLGSSPFQYRFFLIEDPSYNAFAVPGGYVFVNTGLVRLMDREDELAGVLAHEISHIHARHMARQMEKAKVTNIATVIGALAAVLIGGPAASALMMGTMAAGESMMLKYSRDDEREADTLGFKWTSQAGYNPRDMISVFSKMNRQRWFEGANIPVYLKTHPELESRIVDISHLMSAHRITRDSYPGYPDFAFFKMRLEAIYGHPSRMARELQRTLRENPDNIPALYSLAIVYKRLGDRQKAIDTYKAALAKDPRNEMIKKDLAIFYIENKMIAEAKPLLNDILAKNPRDEVAIYYLACIAQGQHKVDEALSLFERVQGLNPSFVEVYYNLGTLYGEKQRLGPAHYYLGLHSRLAKDLPTALFHFRKALHYLNSHDRYYQQAHDEVARLEKMKVKPPRY